MAFAFFWHRSDTAPSDGPHPAHHRRFFSDASPYVGSCAAPKLRTYSHTKKGARLGVWAMPDLFLALLALVL